MRNNSTWALSAFSPIPWPKGAWNPVLVVLVGIGIVVLELFPTIVYLVAYNAGRPHGAQAQLPPAIDLLLAQTITYVPVAAFLLYALPRLARVSLGELGIRKPTLREIGIGLAGTAAMWVAVVVAGAVASSLTHRHDTESAVAILKDLKGPFAIATFFLVACVLAPIVEELIFRVYVFGALTRYVPVSVSALVSGALFGLVHMSARGQVATIAIPLALGGVVLALVYATTRCFWSNVATHACFNTINVVALIFFHAS